MLDAISSFSYVYSTHGSIFCNFNINEFSFASAKTKQNKTAGIKKI